jgi:hypothetical protein
MLKFLRIESSKFTPGIVLDPIHFIFEFYGFSLPENAIEFYSPVIEWLHDLRKEITAKSILPNEINVIFKLVYYNSASLRQLIEIFHTLSDINQLNISVKIAWQYDSEDPQMAEAGKELGDITKIPVNIVAYN